MKITKRLFSLLLALLLVAPVLQVPSYAADLGSTAPQVENENTLSEVELQGIKSVPKMTTQSIISVAAGAGDHCLTFYSATPFSLRRNKRCKYDGEIQALAGDPSGSGWAVWAKTTEDSSFEAAAFDGAYYVSIRGDDNTYVNGPEPSASYLYDGCFDTYGYSTDDIYCQGDVNYILSYEREATEEITTDYALAGLFSGWKNIVTVPTANALALGTGALWRTYFYNSAARQFPTLPAEVLGIDALYCTFGYWTLTTPPIILAKYYCPDAMRQTFSGCQQLLYPAEVDPEAEMDEAVTADHPPMSGAYIGCRALHIFTAPTTHNSHPYNKPWYYPFNTTDTPDEERAPTDYAGMALRAFRNCGSTVNLTPKTTYYIYNTKTTKDFVYTVNDKIVHDPNGVVPQITITDPANGAGTTITYSLDDGATWLTADQLKAQTKEVKDYPIKFKLVADGYDDAVDTVNLQVRKEIKATNISDVVATYDGDPKGNTITVTDPAEASAYQIMYSGNGTSWQGSPCRVVDANDEPKTVYYKIVPTDTSQYFEKTGTYTIKVNKSTIDVTAEDLEYNESLQPVVLKAKDANTNAALNTATFQYKLTPEGEYSDEVPQVKDEGTYPIYYKVTAGSNYEEKEGVVNVTVSNLPAIEGNFGINSRIYYDGEPHSITVEPSNPADALIEYSDDGENFTAGPAPTLTEPGTIEAWYRVSKPGYKTILQKYTLTVAKKRADSWKIEVTNPTHKYDGPAFDPTVINNIKITEPADGFSDPVFSLNPDNFDDNFVPPVELGEHTIYFKISHPYYEDYIGSYTLNITDKEMITAIPIYILYNKNSGEHLLTSKINEYNKLPAHGWKQEGIAFYAYDKPVVGGTPIYRIFNPKHPGGDHHYTKSLGEANKRISEGWRWDFGGKPVFYGLGDVTVYKLYNKYGNFRHHYTRKKGEYDKLGKLGWIQEGVAWMAAKEGDQAELLDE